MPLPSWTSTPLPETVPLKATLSDRLNASVAVFATSPMIEPDVPPLPICSVPWRMAVPPL